jgi:DeoR/GlpR family transcriptional regulator of sugar metabolism
MDDDWMSNVEERQQEIHKLVKQYGRISVDEISQQIGIPREIANSDLQALAERRRIVLTYNGAASLTVGLNDLSLALRTQQQSEEKEQIAMFCVGMIQDGDAIFLDGSSTALSVASHLKNHRRLTLVSNCLGLVQQLPHRPDWQILMPGGAYHWETDSLDGSKSSELLQGLQVDKGFFGAYGINLTAGLTDISAEQAMFKALVVNQCRQMIVMVDSTKWNQVGRYPFARLEQASLIVTDSLAPGEAIEQVRAQGIQVTIV